MIKRVKVHMVIPDYDNLKETKMTKKYICQCNICKKEFKCSMEDAEVCKKCFEKYFR